MSTRTYASTLRLPLATGAQALALGIPTGVLQLLSFGPMFITDVPDWVPHWVSQVVVLTLGLLWALWFFVVLAGLVEGWQRRASDVELSPAGVRVLGGRAAGLRLPWSEVGPESCRVERTGSTGEGLELVLEGAVVAVTTQADELESFHAVAATVTALSQNEEGPRPVRQQPHALRCASCGAALVPAPGASVVCAFCATSQPMPAEVQVRFAALGALTHARERVEGLLSALIRQPGALATNVLMALAVPPMLLAFPLTSVLFNEFSVTRHVLRGGHALWLLPFALGATFSLALWLQAQVAGRQAIRVVTLAYRARPPEREGEPWCCRVCGGPLPEAGGHQTVHCLYCSAASLTGIDLRVEAGEMATQAGGLEEALRGHLRRRRRWRLSSAAAAVLFFTSVAALAQAFPRTCRDGVVSAGETDVDCGGRCTRCDTGRRCAEDLDCVSAVCRLAACSAPSCGDSVRNGGESDVDCGGPCAPCAAGRFCEGSSANCASGRCNLGGACD